MKNINYIITLEPKEQFDVANKSLGMSDKLAVFYSPSIGRKRYYRNSINNPAKGLKLLVFKTEKSAQRVVDRTKELFNDEWKVEIQQEKTLPKTIEIKIDRKTLPKDGQKVEWQTYQDINNEVWKQGIFVSGDNLFCVGFGDSHSKCDNSFDVFHWRAL